MSYVSSGSRSPSGSFESAARCTTASKPSRSSGLDVTQVAARCAGTALGGLAEVAPSKKKVSSPTTSCPASRSIGHQHGADVAVMAGDEHAHQSLNLPRRERSCDASHDRQRQLPARERLGVAARRARLHAAQPHQAEERLRVEPVFVRWLGNDSSERGPSPRRSPRRSERRRSECRGRRRTSGSRTRGSGGRGTYSRSARKEPVILVEVEPRVRQDELGSTLPSAPRRRPSPRRQRTGRSRRGTRARRLVLRCASKERLRARPGLLATIAVGREHDPRDVDVGTRTRQLEQRRAAADLDVVGVAPERGRA